MTPDSIIKDPNLAPDGERKIEWVAQHAPVLNAIFKERLSDGALRGRKLAMAIHLEAKTAYLAMLLSEAGADVTVSGSNPLSTQDRSEEHTSELQSRQYLVCRLLLEKKKLCVLYINLSLSLR